MSVGGWRELQAPREMGPFCVCRPAQVGNAPSLQTWPMGVVYRLLFLIDLTTPQLILATLNAFIHHIHLQEIWKVTISYAINTLTEVLP